MFIFWIACDRISIWKEMYLVSRKIDFHMVEDMHTLYSIILSGVQNTEKSGSYSFAGRLQAAVFISDMIKIMKGNLARQMFLAHPELKQELWGGHLRNPSYCAVTVSDRSREQVLAYIESQKENESSRKRKSKREN